MLDDDGHVYQIEREIDSLKAQIIQLKWLLKCKDDPSLCPCGGRKGDYHSHALNCKEICPGVFGVDYGVLV